MEVSDAADESSIYGMVGTTIRWEVGGCDERIRDEWNLLFLEVWL
jgi:hypothetical protein